MSEWNFRALFLITVLCLFGTAAEAQTGPSVFIDRLKVASGVTTDLNGNVIVVSDNVDSLLISKYSPSGSLIRRVTLGDFFSYDILDSLATDPVSGNIYGLGSNGDVRLINPSTLSSSRIFNIKNLNANTSTIYDVASHTVGPQAGLILPRASQTSYGDIAISRRNGKLNLYVSGISTAFPFIMRIPMVNGQPGTPDVIIASLASAAPADNQPRGVAVNRDGWLLTTLPINISATTIVDFPYTFHEDVPPDQGGILGIHHAWLFYPSDWVTSRGMATDLLGKFYVATGGIGAPCGVAGVLIFTELDGGICMPLNNQTSARPADFAVSPDGTTAYMAVYYLNGAGQILKWKLNGAIFSDVPAGHWAQPSVEALFKAGVTKGCGGSKYCLYSNVTRAEMAIFLLRALHGSNYTPPPATGAVFRDVPAQYWAAAWIERLAAEGYTQGCGNGNYCPDSSLSRAEMAIFLLRAKFGPNFQPAPATGNRFLDVPASYWAAAWIERLASEGITQGCGDGTRYCPVDLVTRAEMAIFLVRTFNLPPL